MLDNDCLKQNTSDPYSLISKVINIAYEFLTCVNVCGCKFIDRVELNQKASLKENLSFVRIAVMIIFKVHLQPFKGL